MDHAVDCKSDVFFLGKNCDDRKEKSIVGSNDIELSNRKGLGCLTDGLWP